ncbi:MAG: isocitrate dehydrogenase (NADP(+)), partial [Candidatus Hydrogenedentota bacterium]
MSGPYEHITIPEGDKISTASDGTLETPDTPIVGFIEGDGIGPDIWKTSQHLFDSAVKHCYGGKRTVSWMEIFAGERANDVTGSYLPDETIQAIKDFGVAIKGPLTTPVGGGFRSLNVALRQKLDLYSCVRPVRHFPGVPSPVKHPDWVDMVIFRENVEDVYA